MAQTPVDSGKNNFLSAGVRELRRLFERVSLHRELRRQGAQRDTALGALGEKAWEEKVDLAPFGDLRDRLHGVAARTGELAATTQQLEAQKSALEAERRDELEKFQARRGAVEDKKRPVDASLRSARERHNERERSIAQARTRLAAVAGELAAVGREADTARSATGAQAAAADTADQRQTALRTEHGVLTDTLAATEAELPGLATEVARLQGETQRYAADLAAIDAEEKVIIARLDGELSRIRSELQAATQQQRAVGKERSGLYRELGRAVYESQNRAPVLDESVRGVAAIDAARAETESRLHASLSATQALPAGTMPKFWGAVVGVPLLAVAVVLGSYALVQRYWPAPAATVTESASTDPEAEKDQAVQRFLQAGNRNDEQTRRNAVRILKEDILTMGATADSAHLPTLAKILRSNEPELRAAAADAIGMIRPTAAQTDALARLLQDPVAPVAEAARRALEASTDPAARKLPARTGAVK